MNLPTFRYHPDPIATGQENAGFEGPDWDDYFRALDRDRSPTAYLFRCTTCGRIGGYRDCD